MTAPVVVPDAVADPAGFLLAVADIGWDQADSARWRDYAWRHKPVRISGTLYCIPCQVRSVCPPLAAAVAAARAYLTGAGG